MSNTHLISSICLFVFTTVIAQLDVATKCGIPALADVNVCLGTSGKRYEVIVGPRVDSLTCDFQIFTSGNKADEDRNFPNIYLTAVNLGKNYDYSNARPKFEPELAKQPSRITDGQISTTTEITTYYLQYRGGLEDDAMPIWGNDTNGKEQQIPATPLKLKVGYQCVNDIPKVAIVRPPGTRFFFVPDGDVPNNEGFLEIYGLEMVDRVSYAEELLYVDVGIEPV